MFLVLCTCPISFWLDTWKKCLKIEVSKQFILCENSCEYKKVSDLNFNNRHLIFLTINFLHIDKWSLKTTARVLGKWFVYWDMCLFICSFSIQWLMFITKCFPRNYPFPYIIFRILYEGSQPSKVNTWSLFRFTQYYYSRGLKFAHLTMDWNNKIDQNLWINAISPQE